MSLLLLFFLSLYVKHRYIHSFPTRRSSDLMEEILHRLEQFEFLRIMVFSETIIHEKPIEEWPFCHVLMSFHSKGFPLDRKSTRLNSSHLGISYAVFCLKKKKKYS